MMLTFTTSAVIFACGGLAANAQDNPVVVIPGGSTIQQQTDQQQTIGQGQPQQNLGQAGEQGDENRANGGGYGGGMRDW
jgi:hypothetical protein